jgi:uncharacterized protein YndB with AHSA1/START domain
MVMEFYESQSTIAATPEKVWAVLTDGAAWPTWDSGVTSVQGTIALGNKITVKAAVGGDRAFPVKVVEFDAPHKLVFSGGMPLGLFRGVRTYTLTAESKGTLFHMREEYTGAMLKAIWKSIPDLAPSFQQFANGLKKRVESRA